MDQSIRVYEYQIKTQFNPVKFNQTRYKQTEAAKTSKVMFKNTSKKTIIIAAIVIALIIATIIFFVVRNKKKKKAQNQLMEKHEKITTPANSSSKQATRPAKPSSVIPTEDQPGATPKKQPVNTPPAANTQPKPPVQNNNQVAGNNIGQPRPSDKKEDAKPPVEPMLIEKKLNEMEEVTPNITIDEN